MWHSVQAVLLMVLLCVAAKEHLCHPACVQQVVLVGCCRRPCAVAVAALLIATAVAAIATAGAVAAAARKGRVRQLQPHGVLCCLGAVHWAVSIRRCWSKQTCSHCLPCSACGLLSPPGWLWLCPGCVLWRGACP